MLLVINDECAETKEPFKMEKWSKVEPKIRAAELGSTKADYYADAI